MLKGIDINQRIEFYSPDDTEETKTVFIFKPISGIGMVDLNGKGILDILDAGIIEVKNSTQGLSKRDYINSLPVSVITQLMEELNKINDVTRQDSKNS